MHRSEAPCEVNEPTYRLTENRFRVNNVGESVFGVDPAQAVEKLYTEYQNSNITPFDAMTQALTLAHTVMGDYGQWVEMQRRNRDLTQYSVKLINETTQYVLGRGRRNVEVISWWPLIVSEMRSGVCSTAEQRESLMDVRKANINYSMWLSRPGGLGDLIAMLKVVAGYEPYVPDVMYGNLPT